MTNPYSNDLRERAVAARFGVAVSSVIIWHQRYRETGGVAPAKMGGYRPIVLEAHRDFILDAIKRTPHLTVYKLRDKLAVQGVNVSHDTVWRFLRREGLSFKKYAVRH